MNRAEQVIVGVTAGLSSLLFLDVAADSRIPSAAEQNQPIEACLPALEDSPRVSFVLPPECRPVVDEISSRTQILEEYDADHGTEFKDIRTIWILPSKKQLTANIISSHDAKERKKGIHLEGILPAAFIGYTVFRRSPGVQEYFRLRGK